MLDLIKFEIGKLLVRLGQELINSSNFSFMYRRNFDGFVRHRSRNRYTW